MTQISDQEQIRFLAVCILSCNEFKADFKKIAEHFDITTGAANMRFTRLMAKVKKEEMVVKKDGGGSGKA